MTKPCKSKSLKFKLDLHIVVLNDEKVIVDGMTAEVAKTATKHKLYGDKLKSILASTLDNKTYMSIKTIIQGYHENNIANLEARYF